jgi:hypothetical protein
MGRPAKGPRPVVISDELAAKYTNTDQFKRFDAAMKKILAVPHAEIIRREEEYKRRSAMNPNRRGPKPKRKPASPALGASPQA